PEGQPPGSGGRRFTAEHAEGAEKRQRRIWTGSTGSTGFQNPVDPVDLVKLSSLLSAYSAFSAVNRFLSPQQYNPPMPAVVRRRVTRTPRWNVASPVDRLLKASAPFDPTQLGVLHPGRVFANLSPAALVEHAV